MTADLFVMPALVTVSRVYPTYGFLDLPNSGKPEFGCHPRLCSEARGGIGYASSFEARRVPRLAPQDDVTSRLSRMRGESGHDGRAIGASILLAGKADDLDHQRAPLVVGARHGEEPAARGDAKLGAVQIFPVEPAALARNVFPILRAVIGNIDDFVGQRVMAEFARAGIGGAETVDVLVGPIDDRGRRRHGR